MISGLESGPFRAEPDSIDGATARNIQRRSIVTPRNVGRGHTRFYAAEVSSVWSKNAYTSGTGAEQIPFLVEFETVGAKERPLLPLGGVGKHPAVRYCAV